MTIARTAMAVSSHLSFDAKPLFAFLLLFLFLFGFRFLWVRVGHPQHVDTNIVGQRSSGWFRGGIIEQWEDLIRHYEVKNVLLALQVQLRHRPIESVHVEAMSCGDGHLEEVFWSESRFDSGKVGLQQYRILVVAEPAEITHNACSA